MTKVIISLNEIKQAFDYIITQKKSREEISSWAAKFLIAEDEGNLEYDPPIEEDKIWDGIQYLTGVDLLNIDGNCLHSIENFIDYKNELFKKS